MRNNRSKRLDVVQALLYHTQRGVIAVGDIGELVAAMILFFAFDDAHGSGPPHPIRLCRLVEALLPSEKVLTTQKGLSGLHQILVILALQSSLVVLYLSLRWFVEGSICY